MSPCIRIYASCWQRVMSFTSVPWVSLCSLHSVKFHQLINLTEITVSHTQLVLTMQLLRGCMPQRLQRPENNLYNYADCMSSLSSDTTYCLQPDSYWRMQQSGDRVTTPNYYVIRSYCPLIRVITARIKSSWELSSFNKGILWSDCLQRCKCYSLTLWRSVAGFVATSLRQNYHGRNH